MDEWMPPLNIFLLDERQLGAAYALVRASLRIDRSSWLNFVREASLQGGGVLGVQVNDQCLYGIAVFRPLTTLRYGRALKVESLVAIELGTAAHVRDALCAKLEQLAAELGCHALLVTLGGAGGKTRSRLRTEWESAGYTAETVEFVRRLDAPPGRAAASI